MPCNERLELIDKIVGIGVGSFVRTHVVFPWIMLGEKGEELFHIVLAVFVIEVDDEGDGSESEYFHLFGLAINL